MFNTVAGDGSNCASSISFLRANMDMYMTRSSLSVSSALLISCSSFSVVSWYKYLVRSFLVKVFIIGKMVFDHFLSKVNKGVPHSTECGVNTYSGASGNFLKTHFQI